MLGGYLELFCSDMARQVVNLHMGASKLWAGCTRFSEGCAQLAARSYFVVRAQQDPLSSVYRNGADGRQFHAQSIGSVRQPRQAPGSRTRAGNQLSHLLQVKPSDWVVGLPAPCLWPCQGLRGARLCTRTIFTPAVHAIIIPRVSSALGAAEGGGKRGTSKGQARHDCGLVCRSSLNR